MKYFMLKCLTNDEEEEYFAIVRVSEKFKASALHAKQIFEQNKNWLGLYSIEHFASSVVTFYRRGSSLILTIDEFEGLDNEALLVLTTKRAREIQAVHEEETVEAKMASMKERDISFAGRLKWAGGYLETTPALRYDEL